MKKFWGILCSVFAVALAVVIGVGSSGFRNWHVTEWFNHWGKGEQEPAPEGTSDGGGGGAVISTTEENGVQLLSAVLPRSAYAANAVTEEAESAYKLTATVSPAAATNVTLEWSAAWTNSSSAWAKNKNVNDYVALLSDGAEATVSCLQAFGEQVAVQVSASAPDCETKTAACSFDYLQKVEEFSVSFGDVACNFGGNTDVIVQFNKNGVMKGGALNQVLRTSETYTIADNFQVTYQLTPSKPFMYNIKSSSSNAADITPYTMEFYVFGSQKGGLSARLDYNTVLDLNYSTLQNYSVKENGLYFGAKWFYTYLGYGKFYGFYSSGGTGTISLLADSTYDDSALNYVNTFFDYLNRGGTDYNYTDGYWYYYVGGLDMFGITVNVTGEHSSFTKETTFHMSGYSVSLDSVSIDNSTVVV